jgi:tRNA1Val (adenine37-N6)-methyltransferase
VRGHRHSIDDAVTGWYALQKSPGARKVLDLGAGVGTVGMIVLEGLGEDAHMTCVEAQETSFRLLGANLECNGLSGRVTAIHGDLRELALSAEFDLITGSPPYFPPHAGTLPKDTQKAYARFELRGNVGDYARVAQRHLHPDGLFVYCFPHQQKQRGIDLVVQQGFWIASCRDVVPTRNSKPLFSVFAARRGGDGPTLQEPPLIVEGDDGLYTPEMLAIQSSRGFGPQGTNATFPLP